MGRMGEVSVVLAADVEAVAVEVTAPCSTPGQSTDSSRVNFSISPACINGMALSNTELCLFTRTQPLLGLPAASCVHITKLFVPFLGAVELHFWGGRLVSQELRACRGY